MQMEIALLLRRSTRLLMASQTVLCYYSLINRLGGRSRPTKISPLRLDIVLCGLERMEHERL